jgi:1-acyl-sn-glycerol-3-phosphate acyltransferase
MAAALLAISLLLLWCVWALLANAILRAPRPDPITGLAYLAVRFYARVFQRLHVVGQDRLPTTRDDGPLLIVCNHTAGIDPVLVQAALPCFVRWMMAKDMMGRDIVEPGSGLATMLDDLWEWLDIIEVDRHATDTTAARVAIRALRAGDVVGIFPEGKLERPQGTLLPFQPGVALIVLSGRAPVLPIFISGTPDASTAWSSLWRRGRARIYVGPIMRFSKEPAEQVMTKLTTWFHQQSSA